MLCASVSRSADAHPATICFGGAAHQATIWRWRTAFQHDFAARLAWTLASPAEANHNPVVVVNGQAGTAPIEIEAAAGQPVVLDAAGATDPDATR